MDKEKIDKNPTENKNCIMDIEWVFSTVAMVFILACLFFSIWLLCGEIKDPTQGIETERTKIVAKELGVKEKDVVLESGDSINVYTATTPKGTYKVKIKYEKDKPIIKNMSEVKLYLKENKDES
ncbi:hypothetical protein SIM22_04375 [Bacillus cereus group sp. BfR-BA-01363]|uniref:hypothetical protein n=1 Tax=Bacillus cereus group sp. BfR-BA-01363 TaxID=3094882 RepID=UPI0029C3A6CD|nr:hypothetical protein [Bacillus cereus group sp. BfR-BA-01363]MDX5853365.1 hypothetical protein [Bacillus cereus group sp. BfR-BA-01363]